MPRSLRVQFPRSTWWKVRTNSNKFSSVFCMHAMAQDLPNKYTYNKILQRNYNTEYRSKTLMPNKNGIAFATCGPANCSLKYPLNFLQHSDLSLLYALLKNKKAFHIVDCTIDYFAVLALCFSRGHISRRSIRSPAPFCPVPVPATQWPHSPG